MLLADREKDDLGGGIYGAEFGGSFNAVELFHQDVQKKDVSGPVFIVWIEEQLLAGGAAGYGGGDAVLLAELLDQTTELVPHGVAVVADADMDHRMFSPFSFLILIISFYDVWVKRLFDLLTLASLHRRTGKIIRTPDSPAYRGGRRSRWAEGWIRRSILSFPSPSLW